MPYLPGKHQSFIDTLSALKPRDFDVCPAPDDVEAFAKHVETVQSAFVEYFHALCNEAASAGIDIDKVGGMGMLSDAFNDIAMGVHAQERKQELIHEFERFPHFRHAAE